MKDLQKKETIKLTPENPKVKILTTREFDFTGSLEVVLNYIQQGLTSDKIEVILQLGNLTTVIALSKLTAGDDQGTDNGSMNSLRIDFAFDSLSLRLAKEDGSTPSDTAEVHYEFFTVIRK